MPARGLSRAPLWRCAFHLSESKPRAVLATYPPAAPSASSIPARPSPIHVLRRIIGCTFDQGDTGPTQSAPASCVFHAPIGVEIEAPPEQAIDGKNRRAK